MPQSMDAASNAPGTAVMSHVPALVDMHGDPDAGRIADFELTLQSEPRTDLRLFLPPRTAANYLDTLVELVRVDLEWRWDRGAPKTTEDYLRQFPELARLKTAVAAIAYEEYRSRLRTGEAVRPGEFGARYDIPTDSWPAPTPSVLAAAQVEPVSPLSATRPGLADAAIPEAGTEFLGFWLMEELGSGPSARVFLARQGDVAGRPVALKVGFDLFAESRPIAHLHHTNVVPIYSLHQTGRLQAVCMPYLGGTTLDRVIIGLRDQPRRPTTGAALGALVSETRSATRFAPPTPTGTWSTLAARPYPAVVAQLGAELASALAHAHERGVHHGAIKPSNVLLADDGVPMFLDFDLSTDARGESPADPYADIYALGVLLYELLTGDLPASDGPAGLPAGKVRTPDLPRAIDSILRRCLGGAYPSALAVRADLVRYARRLSFWGRVWGCLAGASG